MIPILLALVGAYLAVGLLFAVPFVLKGVQSIDDDAVGAGFGFRLFILPGTVMLWPILALRWARGAQPPLEKTPHKRQVAAR